MSCSKTGKERRATLVHHDHVYFSPSPILQAAKRVNSMTINPGVWLGLPGTPAVVSFLSRQQQDFRGVILQDIL